MTKEEILKKWEEKKAELDNLEADELMELKFKQQQRRHEQMLEIYEMITAFLETEEKESCDCCCECEDEDFCTFNIDTDAMTKEEALDYASKVIKNFYKGEPCEEECGCDSTCPNCSGAMKAPEESVIKSFGFTYINDNGKEFFIMN